MTIFSKIRNIFRRKGKSNRWRYEKDGKTKYYID